MFKLIEWNETLELSDFYSEAKDRGFVNNSSQNNMIDCFKNERDWNVWILYKDKRAIGSVAAHSFDNVMGPNSFRILTRVCTFGEVGLNRGLTTPRKLIIEHQNLTDQYLLPKCIEWAGTTNIYATSNDSSIASQKLVHKIYFPTLEKIGLVTKTKEIFYRGIDQTVWEIHGSKFLDHLAQYPIKRELL